MTSSLSDVLADGQIHCAYQPIVDLRTRRTFGFESLVRCQHKDYPNALAVIEAAVAQGFMGELGRELRRMTVEQVPGYALFINLHPVEFDHGWLVRPDDATALHPHDVFLEITESVPLTHFRHCHSVLKEMRAKGLKLAVDDLGAGYSNLKYIADLAPEVVKLDRMLVANLDRDARLRTLVGAIVDLCNKLGARVVAEGIETREELLAAMEAGAHYGQGYFLGRPHPEPKPVDWSALEI